MFRYFDSLLVNKFLNASFYYQEILLTLYNLNIPQLGYFGQLKVQGQEDPERIPVLSNISDLSNIKLTLTKLPKQTTHRTESWALYGMSYVINRLID